MRIIALVEMPRRIFVKSNADLRSNVLIAQKLPLEKMRRVIQSDYPIYADMIRKVGFKMGKGYSPLFVRDRETGIQIRDQNNELVPDTDFRRVGGGFDQFTEASQWHSGAGSRSAPEGWEGAVVSDVLRHPNLDLKPRRLMPAALVNLRRIRTGGHVALSEIALVVKETADIVEEGGPAKLWRVVAGLDIRAIEGIVTPSAPARAWRIAQRKTQRLYRLRDGDIIVGLVRPERRNIGFLLGAREDTVGVPDGIAAVRVKEDVQEEYPQEWLFAALRSESCRLQFWTESGGTSYGKLADPHIEGVLIPVPSLAERRVIAERVKEWALSVRDSGTKWSNVGSSDDQRPIVNSSGFGLIETDDESQEEEDDD